jgi:hypothetical protein
MSASKCMVVVLGRKGSRRALEANKTGVRKVHVGCPCWLSMLVVHVGCPCWLSMLVVHVGCPCWLYSCQYHENNDPSMSVLICVDLC